jgi:ATP-dependent DNA ligase
VASRFPKLAVPLTTKTMEAKSVSAIPHEAAWQFEPKWDGFRSLVFFAQGQVEIRSRSGTSLNRYFPEVVEMIQALPVDQFVLDGELVIADGDNSSFDTLQQRLHPAASRVNRLAKETPATLEAFDCLMDTDGHSLLAKPLIERREALESLVASFGRVKRLRLSTYTRNPDTAERWLQKAGGALDGVVGKRLDEAYRSGERAMIKVKKVRTADCVVGGFRYRTGSRDVGSLLLGLYNSQGKLDHVGFTSSIPHAQGAALARKLESRIQPPGFTGKAPGAPSRWSKGRSSDWEPLKPDLVVEVAYDQVTNDRFRHGTTLLRWRPDKKPRQCTFEQLKQEAAARKPV